MNSMRIGALVLIVAGVLALAYGGFSFTTKKHEATIGNVDIAVNEKKSVDVPTWAGIAAIVIGGGLFIVGMGKTGNG